MLCVPNQPNLVLHLNFISLSLLTVLFYLILISSGPHGSFVLFVTTDFTSTVSLKASHLQSLTLWGHTSAHITKTELINQTTFHYCFYSNMPKRKQTPKIKLATPGLGGKSKEDLVKEANQRRLEKIQAAKEKEEAKQH